MQLDMSSHSKYYTIRVLYIVIFIEITTVNIKHLSCIYISIYDKIKRKTAQNNTNRVF